MTDKKYDDNVIAERFEKVVRKIKGDTPDRLNAMLSPQVISFDAQQLTSRIRFEKREWEKNQREELHGGSISSMFDVAMGMSICAFEDVDVTTADLAVSFIRPFMGDAFLMDVEVIHPGRSLVRIRCKATDEDSGKLLASATGTFVRLKLN